MNQQTSQKNPLPNQNQVPSTPFESPAPVPPSPFAQTQYPPTPLAELKTPKSYLKWIIIGGVFVILLVASLAIWKGWVNLNFFKQKANEIVVQNEESQKGSAIDNQRKKDLAKIKDSLKKYYLAKQSYPTSEKFQKTSDPNFVLNGLVPEFIDKIPVDPLSPTYYYAYLSDGRTFELTSVLEDRTDPAVIKVNENLYIYKITDSSIETPIAQ